MRTWIILLLAGILWERVYGAETTQLVLSPRWSPSSTGPVQVCIGLPIGARTNGIVLPSGLVLTQCIAAVTWQIVGEVAVQPHEEIDIVCPTSLFCIEEEEIESLRRDMATLTNTWMSMVAGLGDNAYAAANYVLGVSGLSGLGMQSMSEGGRVLQRGMNAVIVPDGSPMISLDVYAEHRQVFTACSGAVGAALSLVREYQRNPTQALAGWLADLDKATASPLVLYRLLPEESPDSGH